MIGIVRLPPSAGSYPPPKASTGIVSWVFGEVNMLSGRRSLVRARATKPGEVIELDHQGLLGLVQSDSELSDILMRAFILRRVELIAAGVIC